MTTPLNEMLDGNSERDVWQDCDDDDVLAGILPPKKTPVGNRACVVEL